MYLNCHSHFSLRYGTASVEQLVLAAKARGLPSLALTDINNTSAAYEFVQSCRTHGIDPVVGVDFRTETGELLFVGIARNSEGFRELCELLTTVSLSQRKMPHVAPAWQHCWVIYPKRPKPLTDFRPYEFLGIRPQHVHHLYGWREVKRHLDRIVMLNSVSFLSLEEYALHRRLRAIDQNLLLTQLSEQHVARATDTFHPVGFLEETFQLYPQIVENTSGLLNNSTIHFDHGLKINRLTFTGDAEDDFELLCKLARNGCRKRYGEAHREAYKRTERELKVIRQQGFCTYFLITWDLIRYAQSQDYYYVGRGSGANSIVAYCLYITDVNPLDLDLYFERFINPYRASPPDFDLDFSWRDRDDVTDYVFRRYGSQHVALLATYNTFNFRSGVRELGKIYGLPKNEIDAIIADPVGYAHERDGGTYADVSREIHAFGHRMNGMPNYLSIHAGGVLISERPLTYHTALRLMPKGFPVTHFDMHHAEDIGFHKYDILSQRGLGHIRDTLDLIRSNRNETLPFSLHDIEQIKMDERVQAQLHSADCMGCFYIESPAMRGLLTKLRCSTYVHLVAASSIIRPGVAKSGMMREYIRRFHRPHSFDYPHPVFEEYLGETFGVMVYQEDVMKIVHHFAGLDLDESDVLRRIMTGKKLKGDTFERLRKKYFTNCRERGHPDELAKEVWRQIMSFSGYSFCKAHSASFAVESFQSLYLKTYYPLEFLVAVINNFGGFYQTEYYFREAANNGASLHAPCVNHSDLLTTIHGKKIYVGLTHVKGIEQESVQRLVHERKAGGRFHSMLDFVQRVEITTDQLELLIRCGAFRFTGKNKYELMWEKTAVHNPKKRWESSGQLFDLPEERLELPMLREDVYDQSFDEMELLGFSLASPFSLLCETIDTNDGKCRSEISDNIGERVTMYGYYVTRKPVRTVKGDTMAFGTWIDKEGQHFDTVHFPDTLRSSPFRGKGIYRIVGKVAVEYGSYSVEAERMDLLPWRADGRF